MTHTCSVCYCAFCSAGLKIFNWAEPTSFHWIPKMCLTFWSKSKKIYPQWHIKWQYIERPSFIFIGIWKTCCLPFGCCNHTSVPRALSCFAPGLTGHWNNGGEDWVQSKDQGWRGIIRVKCQGNCGTEMKHITRYSDSKVSLCHILTCKRHIVAPILAWPYIRLHNCNTIADKIWVLCWWDCWAGLPHGQQQQP